MSKPTEIKIDWESTRPDTAPWHVAAVIFDRPQGIPLVDYSLADWYEHKDRVQEAVMLDFSLDPPGTWKIVKVPGRTLILSCM